MILFNFDFFFFFFFFQNNNISTVGWTVCSIDGIT
jgi:hypothetical protein